MIINIFPDFLQNHQLLPKFTAKPEISGEIAEDEHLSRFCLQTIFSMRILTTTASVNIFGFAFRMFMQQFGEYIRGDWGAVADKHAIQLRGV